MVIVFGSINVDVIIAVDRLPLAGETVLGSDVALQPGGKGANQAVAAAKDGGSVAMAGAVGHDPLAEIGLSRLRQSGVDLRRVETRPAATGCATICTDRDGRNQIAVGAGANFAALASQVADSDLTAASTVVLQMEVAAEQNARLIHRARAAGARVILNLAPAAALPAEALRAVDLLVVNEHEADWLARHLHVPPDELDRALGVTVLQTLGERGATFSGPLGQGAVPAMAVAVADTTAAGDCFTGVLAAALDRGATLAASVRRANVAAGLCCTRKGSQVSLPDRAEIDAALRAV